MKRESLCKKIEKFRVKSEYNKNLNYDLKTNLDYILRKILWNAKTLSKKEEKLFYHNSSVNQPNQELYKMYYNKKSKKWITEDEHYYLGASFLVSNKTGKIINKRWNQLSRYERKNSHIEQNIRGMKEQKAYKLSVNRSVYKETVKVLSSVKKELDKLNLKSKVIYQKRITGDVSKIKRPFLVVEPIEVQE